MGNSLLSIDWDYFISLYNENCVSSIENKRTIIDLWNKKYLTSKLKEKIYNEDFFYLQKLKNFGVK